MWSLYRPVSFTLIRLGEAMFLALWVDPCRGSQG